MKELFVLCFYLSAFSCAALVIGGFLHGRGRAEYQCGVCHGFFFAYPGDYQLQCPHCWTVSK